MTIGIIISFFAGWASGLIYMGWVNRLDTLDGYRKRRGEPPDPRP